MKVCESVAITEYIMYYLFTESNQIIDFFSLFYLYSVGAADHGTGNDSRKDNSVTQHS